MAIDNPNIMLGMSFRLLGTELIGAMEAADGGQRIWIDQNVEVPNEGVPITQLAEDVKRLLGTKDDIPELGGTAIADKITALHPADRKPKIDVSKLVLCLQTVYLDINKPKTGAATADYAFRVIVKADGLLPPMELIQIHYLTLSIWNTKKPEIQKRLGLLPPAAQA